MKFLGPMSILRELWTGEVTSDETRTTYQYIMKIREPIDEYLICAVMKTQLLIYNTQQMRYANTIIVCNIMSVLLHIFLYIKKCMPIGIN